MKAIVTAGNKRLGKRIATFLQKKGYTVFISYHSGVIDGPFEAIRADFSTLEGVNSFCDQVLKLGQVDLLVNNFGPLLKKPLLETTSFEMHDQFQKIVFTPFTLMNRLFSLIHRANGTVINIGVCGLNHKKVNRSFPIYKLAKESLLSLTKSFAKEGIRVNMISPGYLEDTLDKPSDIKALPQKRLISYEEILSVLDFLIDPKNGSITGQNFEVSGGVGL